MTKRKWILLILAVLLLVGYFKLFYKTYSETVVTKSADCIIALDVKRARNTLIWNLITTPSQWKKVSFSSSREIDWKDMVKIPDYVFIFHAAGQPANTWYTVLEIKDKEDFDKGITHYHFEKVNSSSGLAEYSSKELGLTIVKNDNHLLLSNTTNAELVKNIVTELFINKQYCDKAILSKNIHAKSHLSIQFLKNDFLQEDAVIKANFDKEKIVIDGLFNPKEQFGFSENDFNFQSGSLLTIGFTQPSTALYNLIPVATKESISKAVNFNIDSLMLQTNDHYKLDITAVENRIDSAVSYSYDDNFNQVEKMVVNNVQEPVFSFTVKGDSVNNIYNYWNSNDKLEKTVTGELFTAIPFARSYCRQITETELAISTSSYKLNSVEKKLRCICFLNLSLEKIPVQLFKYLPGDIAKAVANIGSVQLAVKMKENQIELHAEVSKKKDMVQLINW